MYESKLKAPEKEKAPPPSSKPAKSGCGKQKKAPEKEKAPPPSSKPAKSGCGKQKKPTYGVVTYGIVWIDQISGLDPRLDRVSKQLDDFLKAVVRTCNLVKETLLLQLNGKRTLLISYLRFKRNYSWDIYRH
ncbi:uncharacterized protein LOC141707839 isoform X2 [Apium graveolens]|uniref:uncharacterized protein LOC141707839 isoform X2 n=1 Tax=Apium graveolens TaxID=4045 RepID=UPI003D7A572F